MKFIRPIPTWLCIQCFLIMWIYLNVNILFLLLAYVFLFCMGYSINCIPLKFPEDEASPYFQIHLNKVVIILFSITFAIGGTILFNRGDFDSCAYFMWVYFNVISGYFSSKFDKA